MQKNLIRTPETKKKERLQKSIDQKRQILLLWNEKIEMLKMDLDLVRHEYDVRIGYLLLKDNQLDLEIIQLKNLKKLMEEGLSYEEALKQEEDKFYNEILRMQEEAKKIDEEKELLESRIEVDIEIEEKIKTLWKKLIRKFHPDLVLDTEEKHQREEIMKRVNEAYARKDLEILEEISLLHVKISLKETQIEDLEQTLVDLENTIISAKKIWDDLKETEWFGWMKKINKAKKTNDDVFAPLEKSLLDDIAKKITIVRSLREDVQQQEVI